MSLMAPNLELSVRVMNAVRSWIQMEKMVGWRAFRNIDTVDVLSSRASKANVVSWISSRFGLDADSQILRIGDNGREDGNDFELLAEGSAVSVDNTSIDPTHAWNFAPPRMIGLEASLWYLSLLTRTDGGAWRMHVE